MGRGGGSNSRLKVHPVDSDQRQLVKIKYPYLIIYKLLVPIIFLHQRNQLDNIRVIIVKLVTSAVEANHQGPFRVGWRDYWRKGSFLWYPKLI
jgi:hypothetical protein